MNYAMSQSKATSNGLRKTKMVCTIGPSTSTREMIWKLAEAGMNVARLNMSHGDHASHQKTIDIVKEYNSLFDDKAIAIMLDTKVCFCFIFCSYSLFGFSYGLVCSAHVSQFLLCRVLRLEVEMYLIQSC